MPIARFDRFTLDPADRRLMLDGAPVELNARYLDALALLVGEGGRLVAKDRFLAEVWNGVPVTDEALTQCVRTLRRALGDDAARPRFIETVPKHGYRFIAAVEWDGGGAGAAAPVDGRGFAWRELLLLGGAATLGGGLAGTIGGLFYGFAAQPVGPGGGASTLLVLVCVTILVGMLGAAGVGFGIAAAGCWSRRAAWTIAGGALGGLLVGAIVKLIGVDAFDLLVGRSPGDITGAAEGALLGGAVGLAAWLAGRAGNRSLHRGASIAALAGAAAGIAISLAGGRLLGGSLDLLARQIPESRLRLDPIGALLREPGFGPLAQAVTAALEGALFAACTLAAMILARRGLAASGRPATRRP